MLCAAVYFNSHRLLTHVARLLMPVAEHWSDGQLMVSWRQESAGQLTGRCQSVMAACSTASPRDATQVITVGVGLLIAAAACCCCCLLHTSWRHYVWRHALSIRVSLYRPTAAIQQLGYNHKSINKTGVCGAEVVVTLVTTNDIWSFRLLTALHCAFYLPVLT